MEVRRNHRVYDITPICTYPRVRTTEQIKRNGFKGDFHGIAPFDLFCNILTDNKAETLLKAGQTNLLRYFIRYSSKQTDTYWNSIRIAIRNGYTITDGSMWCDYIDLLNYFGKDTNSPKYVCPESLVGQHDLYVKRKRAEIERQRLEEKRKKAREDEAKFKELKSKFFGIEFSDGVISIRVLDSVMEFAEEGTAMHHCVFTNAYYLKENSLILSATIDGKRIETVEISLKTMEVVQSRGICNKNTEYHDRIIKLVNKNRKLIRQRLTA
jgi:hypothetical protein